MKLRIAVPANTPLIPVDNDQQALFSVDADPELVRRYSETWDELQRLTSKIFQGNSAMALTPGTQFPYFGENREHPRQRTP